MKRLFLFTALLILVLTLSISAQKDKEKKFFRAMTYNIRYAGDEKVEGINSWNNRKEKVAAVIRFSNADIIGLQEALKLQIDDLLKMFPGYSFIGAGRGGGEKGEYSAIFYSEGRFQVLDHSTFWLSETPDKASKGWDAAFNRIVTWGKFKDKITGNIFFHFNTHFDHIGEKARINSAKLLLKKIKETAGNKPVILTGDFNFNSSSEPYKIITQSNHENKLFDAQFISIHNHYGSNTSFNNFGKNIVEGNKIDFIFVNSDVKVIQHGIISEKFNGNYPSDHMPVLAEVWLNAVASSEQKNDSTALVQLLKNDYKTMGNWDIKTHIENCTKDYLLIENGEIWDLEKEMAWYKSNSDRVINRKDYFDIRKVAVFNNTAYAVYKLKSEIEENGKSKTKIWNESIVFRKVDGKWKIAVIHSTPILKNE